MGMVTPVGLDVPSTWEALLAGKSGVGPITLFEMPDDLPTRIAAEAKDFDPLCYMTGKDARRMDRFCQFAVAATLQAAEQAQLRPKEIDGEVGVIIGSSMGGITTVTHQIEAYQTKGLRAVSPFLVPMMMPDAAAAQASIFLGADGPNFCTTSACASSADGVGAAFEMVRRGDCQVMVAGGADATINLMGIVAFDAARALSIQNDRPEEASRPFDLLRDGFIMGEGSGVLVLEELSIALKRGAPILAEVVGYGASSDARHMAQPDEEGRGAAKAVRLCLDRADKDPSEVDYINAHGTSTYWNDRTETKAIKEVFGERAYRLPVSSTKSMTGHDIGAAGAIEAIVCVLAIQRGMVPPTMNQTHPDPECDLDYVPNACREAKVHLAVSNSFGFGGHNSVLAFQEYVE
jgi:beta-ketoacyl-acyl-carrier-protein synthase II